MRVVDPLQIKDTIRFISTPTPLPVTLFSFRIPFFVKCLGAEHYLVRKEKFKYTFLSVFPSFEMFIALVVRFPSNPLTQ